MLKIQQHNRLPSPNPRNSRQPCIPSSSRYIHRIGIAIFRVRQRAVTVKAFVLAQAVGMALPALALPLLLVLDARLTWAVVVALPAMSIALGAEDNVGREAGLKG